MCHLAKRNDKSRIVEPNKQILFEFWADVRVIDSNKNHTHIYHKTHAEFTKRWPRFVMETETEQEKKKSKSMIFNLQSHKPVSMCVVENELKMMCPYSYLSVDGFCFVFFREYFPVFAPVTNDRNSF